MYNFISHRYNRKSDSALERHISEVWTERLSKEPWLFNGAKFRLHSFILVSPNHQPSTYSSHAPPEHSLEGVGDGDALLDHSDQRNRLPKTENNDVKQHSTGLISIVSPTNEDRKSKGGAAEHGSEPILVLRLGLTSYKEYLGTNWSCDAAELRQRGQAEFKDPLALLAQPLGVGAILCTSDDQVVFIRRSQKVAEAGGLLDIPGGHPEPKVTQTRLHVNKMLNVL